MEVFSLSSVDFCWFYRGSSEVLFGSSVFFRLITYVFSRSSEVFSIVVIPKNNSALNRYFYFLYTVQLVFSSNDFLSVYNIYPQEY